MSACVVAAACLCSSAGLAQAETRTLRLYFIHTKEKAEITYKKDGRYISSGLDKVNKFLRDWRRNEPTKMDPRLLDTVWEVYKASGSRDYIHVVSAYRSPATNSMLRGRSRGSGVAEKSQHMLGKAMDFYIPDVKLATLRNLGLKKGAGGVGYYPKSGSPFVHFDVGNVRHWPRMSRSQLLAVFPKGDTIHVPSDGKPLPGYKQALAAYESRKRGGGSIQLASEGSKRSGGFLSAFFGGGADEEEDASPSMMASASPHTPARAKSPATAPAQARSVAPSEPPAAVAAVPAPQPEPVAETPETIIAALPARNVPMPIAAPRPQADAAVAMMAAMDTKPAAPTLDPKKAVEEAIAAGAAASGAPVLEAPFEAESALAFNVPLPTRRPDYAGDGLNLPEAAPALMAEAPRAPATDGPTLVAAIVDTAPPSRTAAAVQTGDVTPQDLAEVAAKKGALNPGAVEDVGGSDPIAELATAYAAVPTARPGARETSYAIAALTAGTKAADKPLVARNEVIVSAGSRLNVNEGAPSQRLAMLDRQPDQSISNAIDSGVKTTSKGAKPRAHQAKADRKSVPVEAEPSIARWALHGERVASNVGGTKAPSFAYNLVRTAPREVYTTGFQQDDLTEKANRFTGKAVEFLSVARFNGS
ncbi:DUF882 domain-containing protein [Tianweitania sediminis]|uniref:Murein endopeptidase K n=1 Tax=Tianweitania sediminis TaxID=1502156 RepID=A0A8J7R1Y4_9HYPH|nr:DUF882 domain-containing protein [Tianweitania sediminis]MBP0439288.1 DUF882 domain-containing protein [Tianweitania sediminis]